MSGEERGSRRVGFTLLFYHSKFPLLRCSKKYIKCDIYYLLMGVGEQ